MIGIERRSAGDAGTLLAPSSTGEASMSEKKATRKTAKSTGVGNKKSKGFSDAERAAMKERAEELQKESRGGSSAKRADGERDVRAKIAEMEDSDRAIAERVHAIVSDTAPDLVPRTWYGMPAYARDGKVVCFFQSAQKAEARYATLGFSDAANLDDGAMWPNSFALKKLTPAVEERIEVLVKQAVS
jgi:uncharacterized protein YdhG (YjbR/CyaY superfamily)